MSIAYVDSSCMVATAFGEPGADDLIKRLAKFDRVLSSAFLEPELFSTLHREGRSNDHRYTESVELIVVTRPLTSEIARVLAAGYLRGADCWHVATALFIEPKPASLTFLTLDLAQQKIAKALGFKT